MKIASLGRCLVASVFVLAAAIQAQTPAPSATAKSCPWLTEGSAARVLGAPVSVSVNVSDAGEGSCMFSLKQGSGGTIKIEVSKSALLSCGKDGTAMIGVGNEATRCKLPGSSDPNAELVNGRVRSMHFNIVVHANGKTGSTSSSDAHDDDLQKTAESVAGNLF
jgi:hypothetical protein